MATAPMNLTVQPHFVVARAAAPPFLGQRPRRPEPCPGHLKQNSSKTKNKSITRRIITENPHSNPRSGFKIGETESLPCFTKSGLLGAVSLFSRRLLSVWRPRRRTVALFFGGARAGGARSRWLAIGQASSSSVAHSLTLYFSAARSLSLSAFLSLPLSHLLLLLLLLFFSFSFFSFLSLFFSFLSLFRSRWLAISSLKTLDFWVRQSRTQ